MAYPTIVFNNDDGSDTQASGAGPAVALYGTGAAIDGSTTITLSVDSPDLSGVSTDGDAVLWVATSAGRKFFAITGVDNTAKTVTVGLTATDTESGLTWAIGGQRADLNATSNRVLFSTDILPGWTVDVEATTTNYTLTTVLVLGVSGGVTHSTTAPITLMSSSTARPLITTATNSTSLLTLSNVTGWHLRHLAFSNTATTRASLVSYTTQAVYITVEDCVFTGGTYGLYCALGPYDVFGCEFTGCTTAGLANPNGARVTAVGCSFHDNTGAGYLDTNDGVNTLVYCTSVRNGYGVRTTGGADQCFFTLIHCTLAYNTNDGLEVSYATYADSLQVLNSIFYGNGAYGIDFQTTPAGYAGQRQRIWSCAFGANVTAALSGTDAWTDALVTLTATPFTDGTGSTGHDDWTLNTGAGGGAACKAVGYLASVPGATGSQVADLGAWQAATGSGVGSAGGLLQGNKRAHKQ